MPAFTPEQQAEIDALLAKTKTELKAEYDAKGSALRAWITAHPLPAARVIGVLGPALTLAIVYGGPALWARLFG